MGGVPVQPDGELVYILVCILLEQVVQVPYVKLQGTIGVVQVLVILSVGGTPEHPVGVEVNDLVCVPLEHALHCPYVNIQGVGVTPLY